jgi:hypothetical protein
VVKVDVKPERRNSLTEKDREELMGIRDEDTDDEIDEELLKTQHMSELSIIIEEEN